jgi:hypothetical protein
MMKRLKMLGLMAAAVCLLGIAASSAFAVKMELPSFSNVTTNAGTDKGGPSELFGGVKIKSPKNESQFLVAANGKEGTFTVDFLEAVAVGEECHSLGDKPGVILTGGKWQMVLDTLAGADSRLILFEPAEVHIECKVLTSLVLVKGKVLGKITGPRGTEFIINTAATSATGQEFKQYENNSGTFVTTQLLSGTNEGTFAESGENAPNDELTLEKETELIN